MAKRGKRKEEKERDERKKEEKETKEKREKRRKKEKRRRKRTAHPLIDRAPPFHRDKPFDRQSFPTQGKGKSSGQGHGTP